jgi:bifunctional DNA-binding transcriptional regulator/antitoxin component of YhaV-PrlF toxin-antitoxin module
MLPVKEAILAPFVFLMTVTVKSKTVLAVPTEVQRRAGIKTGDRLEFRVSGGIINIIPALPSADDEYTPEQRKIIDARLAEGLADIKAGRVYGPFETHEDLMNSLRSHTKKGKAKTGKRVSR